MILAKPAFLFLRKRWLCVTVPTHHMKTKICSGDDARSLLETLRFPRHIQGVRQDMWLIKDYSKTIKKADVFASAKVVAGETIVKEGELTMNTIRADQNFAYASVPLGVILSGEIVVIQEGRGIRRLVEGDFIGLFETSFYISFKGNRVIGTWTLVADTDVTILFFGKHSLDHRTDSADTFRRALVELARNDTIPKPITDLPVLDKVAHKMTSSLLKDALVIMHTHLLPSNVGLIRHLAHLVSVEHLFVLEKPYSTIRSAYTQIARMGVTITPVVMDGNMPYEFALQRAFGAMWEQVIIAADCLHIKKIIILDDGGSLLLSVPWHRLSHVSVMGVEQTRRGIRLLERTSTRFPPTVNVASSSVKTTIESSFIAQGVVRKLASMGVFDSSPRIGIVGVGAIGSAIKNLLAENGLRSTMYDVLMHEQGGKKEFGSLTTMDSILEASDVIIGCTGFDTMNSVALDRVMGHKILISASSRDVEFSSLLNSSGFAERPFTTASVVIYPGLTIDILNGGYPINFDREQEWESAEDMQITRCLMYAAFIQATKMTDLSPSIHELSDDAQKDIVALWRRHKNGIPNKNAQSMSIGKKAKNKQKKGVTSKKAQKNSRR